jgi:methylglutaconyl-CoA hydratase
VSHTPDTKRIKVTDFTDPSGRTRRLIVLNRPEKLNCLSLEMLDGLLAALENTKADQIILASAGRAFCTGLDLDEVKSTNGGVSESGCSVEPAARNRRAAPTLQHGGRRHLERLVAIYRWLLQTRCETVALAGGYAVGGGAGLMACAKTVIVSDDFRFRLPGGKLAQLAAVVPPVCTLRTGGKVPAETGWLGCELNADEARQLGLVDRIVSSVELSALIESVRDGRMPLELQKPVTFGEGPVRSTLSELDQYLQRLTGE